MENALGQIPAFQEERFTQSAENHMVFVGILEKRPHLMGSGTWEESKCVVCLELSHVTLCPFLPS